MEKPRVQRLYLYAPGFLLTDPFSLPLLTNPFFRIYPNMTADPPGDGHNAFIDIFG